ncbi:solute carrier family 49 member A3-like [Physella acuta]|uniref:solute carrier family 49 member A3-like n=1 Tax=Physella acuta TaxID=109671 RepID=UPI0027DD66DF|nr:solute carrier family 49 member A3-like [Physella acuta]XP_059142551.1 solute carrier family 49 member A3-like [Physella acuta]
MADISDNNIVIVTENALDKHYEYLKDPSSYKVYKQRWFLLFIIAVINFTNALIWIMFSPVTDQTSAYYKISFMDVNWLSLVYLVVSIPCGFFASWMLDTLGLRASIILAAWLNLIGSALRNLTVDDLDFIHLPQGSRFPVLISGQVVAACGQTFIMFTPAKVAALWFGDNQRAIATTIATLSNPLGILAANILSPAIVKKPQDISIMLWVCSGISLFGALLSSFCVRSSVPPTPPSPSAASQSEPFFIGIKKLRNNRAFWLLSLSMGGGLALFTANTTFLEQILCPQNYDNNFAGLCGALMIGLGAVGAFIAGFIADKTKKFAEVTKIGFCLSTLCGIAFAQLARLRGQAIATATSITMFGFFGFAVYPTSLELAVELTYPVAEATSTGIIFLSGQIQGIILMLVAQYTAQPLTAHASTLPMACPNSDEFEPQDWTIPNLICNGLGVVYCMVIVLLFQADYRRMRAEDKIKASCTLQGKMESPVNQ